MYRVAILTISDKGSQGEREDKSGQLMKKILEEKGYEISLYEILPDDRNLIAKTMKDIADQKKAELILTTGGTGFSKRDLTPEATLDVVERLCPGIPEAMRALSLKITPRAMLTRSTAGIRKESLIVNMPGSPKAVKECLEAILDQLNHGLDILTGRDGECAR